MHPRPFLAGLGLLLALTPAVGHAQTPRPADAPAQAAHVLLDLPGSGADPEKIDYATLPVLKGTHAVVCPRDPQWKFQLHDYPLHHDGKFWCLWSHGPAEDEPPQHVRWATSADGLHWGESRYLTPAPREGYAYIARGFWPRDGELLALVAHFKGKGAFGVNKDLKLEAYVWDEGKDAWVYKRLVYDNAINSYPPQKLPTGEWMVTRRDARFNVSMLIGGTKGLGDWDNVFVTDFFKNKVFRPDEPIWWPVPGKGLVAVIRDNAGSQRLYHTTSADNGRTWTPPVRSNFPNATSKVFSLPLGTGHRVLIGNANPKVGRRQLLLAVSPDGLVFTRLYRLDIPSPRPSTLQYPHALEKDGKLYIVFSRDKATSEVFVVEVADIVAGLPPAGGKKE